MLLLLLLKLEVVVRVRVDGRREGFVRRVLSVGSASGEG